MSIPSLISTTRKPAKPSEFTTELPFLFKKISQTRFNTTALVLGGTIVLGILAQLNINLGAVPITGQTFGVLMLGMALGTKRAVASVSCYVAGGLAGIPWFAHYSGGPLIVFKPSFGYLIGFIAAAAFVGWMSERGWDRKIGKGLLMYLTASVLVYAFGLPYLWVALYLTGTTLDWSALLWTGAVIFIPGDIVKCALAACLSPAAWTFVNKISTIKPQ